MAPRHQKSAVSVMSFRVQFMAIDSFPPGAYASLMIRGSWLSHTSNFIRGTSTLVLVLLSAPGNICEMRGRKKMHQIE
jgi:hypothetical protein